VDAGLANGETIEYGADLATDGVDEIIMKFLPRPVSKIHLPVDHSLAVHATDAGRAWCAVIGPGTPTSVEITGDESFSGADCSVQASANDLYLLLWNRRDPAGLDVAGDETLLDAWRTELRVRWR
jgi:hypothetical protein